MNELGEDQAAFREELLRLRNEVQVLAPYVVEHVDGPRPIARYRLVVVAPFELEAVALASMVLLAALLNTRMFSMREGKN